MASSHVQDRLVGIQQMLMGAHRSGTSMSSATKGRERESFIDGFLAGVLPPVYRFGSGDATDESGRRSGQLDVVIEYPFSPSLPIVGGGSRLYLAEGIAAVLEVKSNVSSQWDEVLSTAEGLAPLQRTFGAMMTMGKGPSSTIPLFAVGFEGWKSVETAKAHLQDAAISGILVIDSQVFVSDSHFGGIEAQGPWALWGLITCIHRATLSLQAANNNPLRYAID